MDASNNWQSLLCPSLIATRYYVHQRVARRVTQSPPTSSHEHKHHEYCFIEHHLQYGQKGVKKGYRRVSICTCHETVMKNSEEPNLGDEGQSALSEQKGTETSLTIRGTVTYDFTIQAFLSWENVLTNTFLFQDCVQDTLHTSLSCPSTIWYRPSPPY